MSAKVSFIDNVSGRHGEVLRSSAMFYYVHGPSIRTTISLLNYWPLKRSIEVHIVASVRRMDGTLVQRERITFDRGMVYNYCPAPSDAFFEGSIEIEVFSIQNLVIPYAAVMAIYESSAGVSMVHSYGRAYSRHEVEEGRTISIGSEGCWTLRDGGEYRSFCVAHNGGAAAPAQEAVLEILNARGESRVAAVALPELKPYASVKLYPEQHVQGLAEFLGGDIGSASLSYRLGESFVRMLVGNETRDLSDFQATHSNFDYRTQGTDYVGETSAYMVVPSLRGRKEVIVYPHSAPGTYRMSTSAGAELEFRSGQMLRVPLDERTETLKFDRLDGELPSRLVTALVPGTAGPVLPHECSLGVLHRLQPRKRMWWGIAAASSDLSSSIVLHDLPEVYGGIPDDARMTLRLYSGSHLEPLEVELAASDLPSLEQGVALDALFPSAREFLDSGFGYYTLFHEYGGLTAYTEIANGRGSACLEHGF